jgi:DNA-binding CsgD family transcriptional regulator/tetratricopeptide (TPR) repeat protein
MTTATRSLRRAGGSRRLVSGRIRELCALQAERQRSALGELRVALVLGDAGLGKTRLATELLPRDGEPAVGLIAHNGPFGDIPRFGPWATALNLHAAGPDVDGVCRACGSGLGGIPALPRRAPTAHDAFSCREALRYHFVEWMPRLLAQASAEQPIVVVLDDAHQGHDAVWEMLLRLSWDSPSSRLLVVATARPAELARHRMAVEVLHDLERSAMVRRIQLSPLGGDSIRELATRILNRDRVPSTLVDWLMTRARGNPRCTVGLLEALVDSGAEADMGTDIQGPTVGRVPETLARWVRTELARLDPLALAVVELLAVAGGPVDPGVLARIIAQPLEDVALALEGLVSSGMVTEQQQDRSLDYQVAHPLTREVLYTDIGGARRRVMHRLVAATLRESGRTEAAASHFVHAARAGDSEAIDALIEMARSAGQQGLCSQGWTVALALQDLLPIGDERWLRLVDALFQWSSWGSVDHAEHYPAEVAAVRRMRRLLTGIGDLQRQAEIRLWLAGLFTYGAGDLDAGESECREALALCQRAGCEPAARTAAIELAKMRGWAGDLPGEELAARRLVNEAERAGDQRGIAEALRTLGHALGWQGRFDAAEDVLLRSVQLAATAAHFSWMAGSLALLASLDACRGNLASARQRWTQAAASSPHYDAAIGGRGALIELFAGDLAMVAAHARQAEGHDPAAPSCLPVRIAAQAAMAAAERGRLTEARRHLDAMRRADSRPVGVLEPLYWWAEGIVARAEGRLSVAAAALCRAVEGYSAMNLRSLRGFVVADLAETAVAAGDYGAAARAATPAHDNAGCTGAPIHQTLHRFATAWVLVGRGRLHQAAQAALRAADEFGSSGYALLAARARVVYARAVHRSDCRAAEDALQEAVVAFDGCGAVLRREQARTLLVALGSAQPGSTEVPRGPDSLTRRERQVAELAAGGYTALQIATRLHIGVRTVETHLAHSYPKLGVTSKQQLVHRAAEFGFTPRP